MPKKKPSFGLSQTIMHKYCKQVLLHSAVPNKSLYSLTTDALSKEGIVKTSEISDKSWVKMNWAHISAASGKPWVPPQKKKQRPPVEIVKTGKSKTYIISDPQYKYDKNSEQHLFYASDEFLRSFEWRKVRMQALKLHGARCQCCGATPMHGAVMNVDHIKPRRLFPELALTLSNLQVLCHDCNHGKGNWDMTDWRDKSELQNK